MTIAKLREAVKVANDVTSGGTFNVLLFLQPIGVTVKAFDVRREQNYTISWEQLSQSNINPLLPAIKIVSEAFQQETSDAEG